MSDILTFQPGVSLAEGKYLLRSSVQPGRWSVTIHGIRAADLTAVVIKTPIGPQTQSRFQSAWMRRSFQALGDMHHPSRARILDWFEQDGRPFLVFQKVKGPSLEQQLQKGPLSEAVALQLIRQVAAGLAGIHSQGLLHRDIQPKNIILRQGVGIPTLVDWGLQPTQSPGDRLTPFSAPEQLQGGDIFKQRLDIYSLAATLYAATTGQAPLHPAQRHHSVPNPGPASLAGLISPRQLHPNLSPETEEVILQGMALSPQQRPATLENWLHLFPLSHSPGSHSPGALDQGRSPNPSRPAPSASPPPPQHWATQPPPSQVLGQISGQISGKTSGQKPSHSALQGRSPATHPPAFSPPRQAAASAMDPHRTTAASRSSLRPLTAQPSLPQRPSSPNPSGTNYVLGSRPQNIAPSHPSERHPSQRSTLGTVTPAPASRKMDASPGNGPSQAPYSKTAMVGTAQRSKTASVSPPFKPFRRLTSISLFMASIGLAGGLFLRVLNPDSVSGFSGLGRAQTFPEADWPGETQLDALPDDVPQPEFGSDRWDDSDELPEAILDDALDNEILAIPSEQLDEESRLDPDQPTVEDYGAELEQSTQESYGAADDFGAGATGGYGNEGNAGEWADGYDGSKGSGSAGDYDYEPNPSPRPGSGQGDPWGGQSSSSWEAAPGITADDFPEPDLPPTYEAPNPQSANPPQPQDDGPYEDV